MDEELKNELRMLIRDEIREAFSEVFSDEEYIVQFEDDLDSDLEGDESGEEIDEDDSGDEDVEESKDEDSGMHILHLWFNRHNDESLKKMRNFKKFVKSLMEDNSSIGMDTYGSDDDMFVLNISTDQEGYDLINTHDLRKTADEVFIKNNVNIAMKKKS